MRHEMRLRVDMGEAVAGRRQMRDTELIAGRDVALHLDLRRPAEVRPDRHAQVDDVHACSRLSQPYAYTTHNRCAWRKTWAVLQTGSLSSPAEPEASARQPGCCSARKARGLRWY